MMNSHVLFRSHLMQQFANMARTQSRPPIALSVVRKRDSSLGKEQDLTALASGASALLQFLPSQGFEHRTFSAAPTSMIHEEEEEDIEEVELDNIEEHAITELEDSHTREGQLSSTASSFQSLISSRRTNSSVMHLKRDLKPAMSRAIRCAQSAPNHMRTEPFTFKRLLSESIIEELSEIAYKVTFQRRHVKDPLGAQHFAERKKAKWTTQVPAYLVTLVENQPDQKPDAIECGPYGELPFVPPHTERQLEDYAVSCAAVQNVLLSLHAEDIGTKRATGPVIKTRAFRDLVGAKATDRIVAMIMVGYQGGRRPREPMRRRATSALVQDL